MPKDAEGLIAFNKIRDFYSKTPDKFCEEFFGIKLMPAQRMIIRLLRIPERRAVCWNKYWRIYF